MSSPERKSGARSVSVCVFLAGADEQSIPLEVASRIDDPRIDQTVVSLFEPGEETFGVDVQSLGAQTQLDPRAYARLLALLCRESFDVLHVHPNASGAVARVLGRLARTPAIVSTEHNDHGHFGAVKNLLNGTTNTLNDVVVSNSACTEGSFGRWEQTLLSSGGVESRVIHNGVDVERVQSASDSLPTDLPDGFLIGTSGRLCHQKNQAALLRAATPLLRSTDETHLVLTSDGPLRADLESLAADLGIADRTTFLGYLPRREQVYEVFRRLDVFVYPSRYEGFGVAAAEAMTAGVPIVANDIPVLREVLGEAAVYADATDTDALSGAIRELYDDGELRARLGATGRRRGSEKFTLDATATAYAALYRELASKAETAESTVEASSGDR